MAPHKRNKNAAGKRVKQDRISVQISLSETNGFLPLINEYLWGQGIEPTEAAMKEFSRDWIYSNFGDWLKRQVETDQNAIII